MNADKQEKHRLYSEEIEMLRGQIQGLEGQKVEVPPEISEYTKEDAQDAQDGLAEDVSHLLREQADLGSRISTINSQLPALEHNKSQLGEEITGQEEVLIQTSVAIAANQAQQVAAQALGNTVMELQGEIADLTLLLDQKNEDLDQIEVFREAFKADVPNVIKEKMTDLLKSYGFLPEQVNQFLPQFCKTDEDDNIVDGITATLGVEDDELTITLPTFDPEANQIIELDGEVNGERAANFTQDPLMQVLLLAECKPGAWITDGNGQQLQLTNDSKLMELAEDVKRVVDDPTKKDYFWFLLNSTLSDAEKINILQYLGLNNIKSKFDDAIKNDIDDSIELGEHNVVQAQDPGFFVNDSSSDVPLLTPKQRLAPMTHLSDFYFYV